ncbi:hypothetical protein J9885_18570 [Aeromonas sp. SrichE-2G]|nr:hypothetical protein [Aeromonas sp. SrichE-2G]MBP4043190.1 hypothetical protein [Aeromonas sp. SrichE-2G]
MDTIQSIISDGVPVSKYEIVVADNSDGYQVEEYCVLLAEKGYNIRHVRNPVLGFYNSIIALKSGSGQLLKLHNDYSCFIPGMFSKMVDVVERNLVDKSTLFFSNNTLGLSSDRYCNDLNEFIGCTNFQNTWSSAFSIWKADLERVPNAKEQLNYMFPHTSLLFNCNTKYLVLTGYYFDNKSVPGKGGYNLFHCFCVNYLGMLRNEVAKKCVTKSTYLKVKWLLYVKFIIPWYYKTVYTSQGYTYIVDDADSIIKETYGRVALLAMRFACRLKNITMR